MRASRSERIVLVLAILYGAFTLLVIAPMLHFFFAATSAVSDATSWRGVLSDFVTSGSDRTSLEKAQRHLDAVCFGDSGCCAVGK